MPLGPQTPEEYEAEAEDQLRAIREWRRKRNNRWFRRIERSERRRMFFRRVRDRLGWFLIWCGLLAILLWVGITTKGPADHYQQHAHEPKLITQGEPK